MYHDDIQWVLEKEIKREAFRKISERAKEIRHHRRQIHQLRSSQRYENDKLCEEALPGLADLFEGSPRSMKKDWEIFEDTTMRLFESKSFNPFAFHCEALDDHRSDEEVEQPPDSNCQTIQDCLKRPRYRVGDLAAESLSPVLPHNEIDEPLLKEVSVVLDELSVYKFPIRWRPAASSGIHDTSSYILLPTVRALPVLPVHALNLKLILITLNVFGPMFGSCTLMMNNMSPRKKPSWKPSVYSLLMKLSTILDLRKRQRSSLPMIERSGH